MNLTKWKTTEELKTHAQNAFKFYQIDLGAPDGAYWLMNPRDYHILAEAFKEKKTFIQEEEFPTILKVPVVTAYVWRKPPIIFMNINDVDFDLENELGNA